MPGTPDARLPGPGSGPGLRWTLLALAGGLVWVMIGLLNMGFFSSDKTDLKHLLGEAGAALVDDAEVTAWHVSPDLKPHAYYAVRDIDEARFRQLCSQAGLSLVPNPALAEAIWQLPEGVKLAHWTAPMVPAGAGLQAQGTVGGANAWLRWHHGTFFLVAQRAS